MRKSTGIVAALAAAGLFAGAAAVPATAAPQDSIADIVAESEVHNTLEFVLGLTGLDKVLDGKRQFTLFAPTDAAFAAVPADTLAFLLGEEQEEAGYPVLTNILLYHVAPGERLASDVVSSSKVRMMSKQFAAVSLSGGPSIDGAPITAVNIDASNGVVHVLGGIMLPPS